ncbi:MAG: hypothetical protein NT040_08085 [Bacteroidetes bacterium]|nr:hypothetical protein [Bacteroidota bacterium]
MKKMNFLLILVILCLIAGNTRAAKWRVNNTGITANFTNCSEMVNSPLVLNGDTVYFESSMFSYGNANITKKLVIIGPGYFLGENDSTQADVKPASMNSVSFSAGSQGTIVKGMSFGSYVTITASGIVLEMNRFEDLSVSICSGIVINRNYIQAITVISAQNVLVSNNLVVKTEAYGTGLYVNGDASATMVNNIFLGKIVISNCLLRNNICTSLSMPSSFTALNSVMENNIGASTQFGTSNGNQQNVDMTAVFTNSGSTDGRYRLKAGSPAIAAGVGGADCGIFGGNYTYVLSGMVPGPSVWYMNMNGIDVTVKAKSH